MGARKSIHIVRVRWEQARDLYKSKERVPVVLRVGVRVVAGRNDYKSALAEVVVGPKPRRARPSA